MGSFHRVNNLLKALNRVHRNKEAAVSAEQDLAAAILNTISLEQQKKKIQLKSEVYAGPFVFRFAVITLTTALIFLVYTADFLKEYATEVQAQEFFEIVMM